MRKKAKLLGLSVACKTPSFAMLVVLCLVANPRHQAPKSALHRLGWLWNSNAYAIRGHRKILSSTERHSHENQCVTAWPRRSDIAAHYEVCQARYTGPEECAVHEAMLRPRPRGRSTLPSL